MNKVKNFFDDFTFHARVMPIMVVTMPIVIAAISKGILQEDGLKTSALFY